MYSHIQGVVEIVIDALYDTYRDQTRTAFRVWW